MTKQEQRKAIKAVLSALPAELQKAESAAVCSRLKSLPEFQSAKIILAYNAMKNELDPSYAVEYALSQEKRVAFPLCNPDHTLTLCIPNDASCFNVGAYGIIEPDPKRSKIISPEELDFIIVPGLSFDKHLNRLGRGAGFYDRLLSSAKTAFCAGVCFSCQLIAKVETEELDMPLHAVVTPENVFLKGHF